MRMCLKFAVEVGKKWAKVVNFKCFLLIEGFLRAGLNQL